MTREKLFSMQVGAFSIHGFAFFLLAFGIWAYVQVGGNLFLNFFFFFSWGIFHSCKNKCYEDKISYNLFITVDIASYNLYTYMSFLHINLLLVPFLLALLQHTVSIETWDSSIMKKNCEEFVSELIDL